MDGFTNIIDSLWVSLCQKRVEAFSLIQTPTYYILHTIHNQIKSKHCSDLSSSRSYNIPVVLTTDHGGIFNCG